MNICVFELITGLLTRSLAFVNSGAMSSCMTRCIWYLFNKTWFRNSHSKQNFEIKKPKMQHWNRRRNKVFWVLKNGTDFFKNGQYKIAKISVVSILISILTYALKLAITKLNYDNNFTWFTFKKYLAFWSSFGLC